MKIGLIGCGIIAATHVGILKKIQPQAYLTVCDVNGDAARQFAQKVGAQGGVYDSVEEMLAREHPDAVHILTPVAAHYAAAKLALTAGCHVYLEKPLTESPAEYRELLALAASKNRVLACGYSTVGMPVVMQAQALVKSGDLGRLIAVHCDFMCAWGGNSVPDGHPDHWAYTSKGGVLQNMVDHPASLVVDALDRVDSYQFHCAWRNLLPHDRPDMLHVSLQNDDQIGSFTLSLGHGNGHRIANYYLEKGTITVDMTRQLISVIKGSGPPGMVKKILSSITTGCAWACGSIANVFKVATGKLRKAPGIFNLVDNFYQVIDGRATPLVREAVTVQMTQMLDEIWIAANNTPVPPLGHAAPPPSPIALVADDTAPQSL